MKELRQSIRDRRRARAGPAPLVTVYRRLRRHFGHAGWWPGETPFEICVGAILVQNTAWTNAEKALAALRDRDLLRFAPLRALAVPELERLIRPSGCYRVKTRRLKAFLEFVALTYAGEVEAMAGEEPWLLRRALLEVPGIGPETADSIVLYAAGLPVFVVDAYTRRVFVRLGHLSGVESYDEIQRLFMARLPRRTALYNDFHAQIVTLAKDVCRPSPRCGECPLQACCPRVGVGPRPGDA